KHPFYHAPRAKRTCRFRRTSPSRRHAIPAPAASAPMPHARSRFMTSALIRTLFGVALASAAVVAQDAAPSADAVLRELKAGNDHHVAKRYQHPHQSADRQRELASGQHPHATVLSCADSRVAPEIIFDQGLGDLFDVRVAGNVAGDPELASIEYAAAHLHCP